MPLGRGVRYRVKHTAHGNVRLAFRGNKVIEAKRVPAAKGRTGSRGSKGTKR